MLHPEPDLHLTARAVSGAPAPRPVNSFIDQTLRKGFQPFSNFLREASPTWTQVKSAIVNVLYSNYVFAPLSDALDKNDLEASRNILLHAKSTDYAELYTYRLNMLKNSICDSLCRMKPHISRSDLKHLDMVDFFLTWKSAFTGERDNLKRICNLQIEILSIDINLGVDAAMKKFFDLRTKLGDDWKATPILPTSAPSWMQVYGFLFKDITLPSLHPVFQTFNEEFFKIKGEALQLEYLERFVSKLAEEAHTYDSNLESKLPALEVRRIESKGTYTNKAKITDWDKFIRSPKAAPVPSGVWRRMSSDLRAQFNEERKAFQSRGAAPEQKKRKTNKKMDLSKLDWSKIDVGELANQVSLRLQRQQQQEESTRAAEPPTDFPTLPGL